MTVPDKSVSKHRNRNYEDTHRRLIETAAELFFGQGADAVSVAALARATRIHRTTIYYHFNTRKDLLSAAKKWLSERVDSGAEAKVSRWVGIDQISSSFARNPDVIESWIERFIADGDIRQRYPHWDRLVAKISNTFAELAVDMPGDPEAYCALIVTGALNVPRLASSLTHPLDTLERVLAQFHAGAPEHSVM